MNCKLKVILPYVNCLNCVDAITKKRARDYQVHQRLSGSCLSQTYFSQSPTLHCQPRYARFLTVSVNMKGHK